MPIKTKSLHDNFSADDGVRVWVMWYYPGRLGTKIKTLIDIYAPELAPSKSLREKFFQNTIQIQEFRREYSKEIRNNLKAELLLGGILERSRKGEIFTFVSLDRPEDKFLYNEFLKQYVEKLVHRQEKLKSPSLEETQRLILFHLIEFPEKDAVDEIASKIGVDEELVSYAADMLITEGRIEKIRVTG